MTEQTIPANAEGLSNGKQKKETLLEQAKKVNETASTVYAMIGICRAAAEFADDQDGYLLAQHVPANLSRVLETVNEMVLDMVEVLERVIIEERARA
ncbi:hypothetical protein [Brucella abortus]|uniref:hypothetical protein n=1 Tax=Brucella abortus TaxID=235 RepID=UPI00278BFBC9|nr:hypothetical protein [Brucella abortus]WLU14244.1 hypothetical protein K1M55_01300 [Brucella abortus]WLU17205.1 hypothetical protein K1M38_01300 [Brucella abortus]WLU31969.1 hypothetical protein K1M80_01300 [Brucella abortus]WLU37876.1 hypothetical protein K1M47_01300 [Brucella abortus]WLU55600.1 hypothetical protein K1M48_01300 [Brucella abortus]